MVAEPIAPLDPGPISPRRDPGIGTASVRIFLSGISDQYQRKCGILDSQSNFSLSETLRLSQTAADLPSRPELGPPYPLALPPAARRGGAARQIITPA